MPTPKPLIGARLLVGLTLAWSPDALLSALAGRAVSAGERRVARVLGARHLVEALVLSRESARGWVLAGAAVDGTHSLTMVLLAVASPHERRLAISSTLGSGAFAAAALRQAIRRR